MVKLEEEKEKWEKQLQELIKIDFGDIWKVRLENLGNPEWELKEIRLTDLYESFSDEFRAITCEELCEMGMQFVGHPRKEWIKRQFSREAKIEEVYEI